MRTQEEFVELFLGWQCFCNGLAEVMVEPGGFVHAVIISFRAVQGGNTSLRGQAESWGCAV